MSAYDLFFSSVDEHDGDRYVESVGLLWTATATALITNRHMTVTIGAGASDTKAGEMLFITGTSFAAQATPVKDVRAGDTSVELRIVGSSLNVNADDGDTMPTSAAILNDRNSAVDLAIDLRDAPTGKYQYILGGFASISSSSATANRQMGLVLTDDLSWSNKEPRPGYAQGKMNTLQEYKPESAGFVGHEIQTPMSALMTAELDSGAIHYLRMQFGADALLTTNRAYNPRLFALRYVRELSSNVAAIIDPILDGSSTATLDSSPGDNGNITLEATAGQIAAIQDDANYVFAGQAMLPDAEFHSGTLVVENDGVNRVIAMSIGGTNPTVAGELTGLAGLTIQRGSELKGGVNRAYFGANSVLTVDTTYSDVMFGMFYCPAVQFSEASTVNGGDLNMSVDGTWQEADPGVTSTLAKQQPVFMVANSSGAIYTTDTGDDSFKMRTVFPSPDGDARVEWNQSLYWRGYNAMGFHVGVVPRGSMAISTDIQSETAGNITSSAFSSQSSLCGATASLEYQIGAERETLVVLEPEIIWTDWFRIPATDIFTATIDISFSEFDQVTAVSVNGVAYRAGQVGESLATPKIFAASSTYASGLTMVVTTDGVDLTDPGTVVNLTVPIRASVLGSDVTALDGSTETSMPFEPRILNQPSIKRTREMGVSVGAIQLENSDGRYDEALVQRAWAGRRARIYTGDPSTVSRVADYSLVYEGEMSAPTMTKDSLTVRLDQPKLSLAAPLDLGNVTQYVGKADANEYTQDAKLPVIYGEVQRAEAVRVKDYTGTDSRYAAMFGDQSFTPTAAYLNSSDPEIAFTIPGTSDDADVTIADTELPGGLPANRPSTVYLDGRGLDFDHAGEICLDILDRFSTIDSCEVNVTSFREVDTRSVLKVDALGDRNAGDAAVMGVALDSSATVGEALDQVMSTVGGRITARPNGRVTAEFGNYDQGNVLDVLPDEAEEWCTFDSSTTASVDAHPGYGARRWATKFKVETGAAQTANGKIILPRPGTYAFEALSVAGSFNEPNDLKVEIALPGETTKTELWHGAVPIDTGYPVANTWDWMFIGSTFETGKFNSGLATIYVTPRTGSGNELDVYLDNMKVVPVVLITDNNADIKSITAIPKQYSEVASMFNQNPLRADVAPTAVVEAGISSSLPGRAADNRLTLPGAMVDAESAFGVATYTAGAVGVQMVEGVFQVSGLDQVPPVGGYLHVDMDRVPTFNYPSKLWRISEVNQKRSGSSDYEITAFRESVSRVSLGT